MVSKQMSEAEVREALRAFKAFVAGRHLDEVPPLTDEEVRFFRTMFRMAQGLMALGALGKLLMYGLAWIGAIYAAYQGYASWIQRTASGDG